MAEEKKTREVSDSEKRERLAMTERTERVLSVIQWAAALFFIAMAAAYLTNDDKGTTGGIMMLIAAWVVSPMIGYSNVMKKLSPIKKALIQAAIATTLFAGGYYIAMQSADNVPDNAPAAESTAVQSEQ